MKRKLFCLLTLLLTVCSGAWADENLLVSFPSGSKSGYSVSPSTTTTVSNSGYTLYNQEVYPIATSGSITLTVPSTTTITKISVSGTTQGSGATAADKVEIVGDNENATGTFNKRNGDEVTFDLVPKNQTTTYVIKNNDSSRAIWVKIKVYGTESGGGDTTPPSLSSSVPANGATGIATSGTIVLTFSEAIASVDASKFTLTGATIGSVAKDGSNNTKVNVPYSSASYEATVTLSVAAAAVADAAGNKSAALSDISFTTKAAPKVVTYWKNDGSEDKTVDDDATTVAANGFEYAGHRFIKWNTASNGSGSDYVVGAAVTTNLDLYAQWEAIYAVTMDTPSNGTISVDKATAAAGETVTLTASPNDGYELNTLTVSKAEGTVETSEVDATHYTFTMPAEAVTVAATFSFVIPGPSDPETVGGAITWDFSSADAWTIALNDGTFNTTSNDDPVNTTLYSTDQKNTITYVAGKKDSKTNTHIAANGSTKTNSRYFVLEISSNGTLGLTTNGNEGAFVIKKAATASTTWGDATAFDPAVTITTTTASTEATGSITYDAAKPYILIGFPDNKRNIQKISWTPASDDITMTTSENMAGWRSFVDATQAYTIKEGETSTKAYIVTSVGANVVLSEYDGTIYKNMPVLLKTDRVDRTIVLTKNASNDSYSDDDNLLQFTTAGDPYTNILRLGYGTPGVDGAVGVGFYPYSTASAPAGVVYLDASISARALSIVFEDEGETTAISEVRGLKAEVRGEYFNLNGQRVAQPTKGLYIVNGRKVVIK